MLLRLLLPLLSLQILLNAQSTHLALSSVHSEMEKILEGHVTQKTMTPELIADSLKLYIVHFDPEAVYLLASEANPYVQLSNTQKQALFRQYEQNDFSRFTSCNKTIQHAILRMRKFRQLFPSDEKQFLAFATQKPNDEKEPQFAKNLDELKQRQQSFIANLVNKVMQNEKLSFQDARKSIEFELEEFENSYLFVDRNGEKVDPAQAQELLTFHILKALTATLDAHTSYLDRQEAEIMRMKLEKMYVGIGIIVREQGKKYIVESIIKGSSADTSQAIQPGDIIEAVEGKPVMHENIASLQKLLEGKANTFVTLDLQRGSKKLQVTLERKEIEIKEGRVDTSFEKVDGGIIGIISLHSFYQGSEQVSSEKDMIKALELLAAQGQIKGIILDLRDNRGGFLMQAVKVAGLFLKSGVVVAAKYSDGTIHYFRDLDPSVLYSGPLVVLVSKETASAAEIVAQALKDYGVAIIVGDAHTFGKGSIQMQTVTGGDGNADSYFKVTVGRYYGVSGKSSQLEGVQADIIVPSFLAEKQVGEEYLTKAITADSIPASYNDPLTDVPAIQKPWFQEYYVPYIQQPVMLYRQFIPALSKNSASRIAKNQNYQELLQKNKPDDQVEIKREFLLLQLQETINILKELISLEKKNAMK